MLEKEFTKELTEGSRTNLCPPAEDWAHFIWSSQTEIAEGKGAGESAGEVDNVRP